MMKIKLLILSLLFIIGVGGCKKDDDKVVSDSSITPNNFLSDKDYDRLVVEVQYAEGFKPNQASIDNMKDFLEGRLNKTAGITITQTQVAGTGLSSVSTTDIRNFEENNRTQQTNGKTLTAYILFVDGEFAENSGNSKVLGIAYGNTSMAIFAETINNNTGGVGEPSKTTVETAVLNHEFGHTLGLVNNGTPVQSDHHDSSNGAHCDVDDCLMYFAVETNDFLANLLGGNIPKLDNQCIADLRANGGK